MNKVNFLIDQIRETRSFTNRLISEIPESLWFTIPEGTDSNFAWQIGHILVAQNFHAITSVTGVNQQIVEQMPIIQYNRIFYGMGDTHRSVEESIVPATQLKKYLDIVYKECISSLSRLNEDELDNPLEPLPFKHPVANTKYEVISWCFKHEMWHCAEMEDLKRRLGYPIVWM